jgi:hypothetical protein
VSEQAQQKRDIIRPPGSEKTYETGGIRTMITPYLVFNGECRDALEFYRAVFKCEEPKVLPYGDYMPEGL